MAERWLICGGRNFANWQMFERWMNYIVGQRGGRPGAVISGMAAGADSLAIRWAKTHGLVLLQFFPNWKDYGRAAGRRRNKEMLERGKPHLVIAFPGGVGTADMVRRTREANVELIEIYWRSVMAGEPDYKDLFFRLLVSLQSCEHSGDLAEVVQEAINKVGLVDVPDEWDMGDGVIREYLASKGHDKGLWG